MICDLLKRGETCTYNLVLNCIDAYDYIIDIIIIYHNFETVAFVILYKLFLPHDSITRLQLYRVDVKLTLVQALCVHLTL